jgi:hypothetical protein
VYQQLYIQNFTTTALNIGIDIKFHPTRGSYFVEQPLRQLFTVGPLETSHPPELLFTNETLDSQTVFFANLVNPATGSSTPLYYPLPTSFTSANNNDLVAATSMDNGGQLPDPEGGDIPHDIYLVVTPPGYQSSSGAACFHDEGNTGGLLDLDACQYGVVTSAHLPNVKDPLDSLTLTLSRELADTISDPYSASILGHHSQEGIIFSPNGEVADNEPPNYSGYVNGSTVRVQAYWSESDGHFIVPDGSLATVTVAHNITAVNQGNVSVGGTGIDGATISVTITDGTHTTTAATTTVNAGTWSVQGINAAALADGPVTYTVTATDAYNNATTITRSATKRTVVPNPSTFVVTDSADASQANSGGDPTDSNGLVSLRSAIAAANFDAGLGGSDTITFAPGLDGTTLTRTWPVSSATISSGMAEGSSAGPSLGRRRPPGGPCWTESTPNRPGQSGVLSHLPETQTLSGVWRGRATPRGRCGFGRTGGERRSPPLQDSNPVSNRHTGKVQLYCCQIKLWRCRPLIHPVAGVGHLAADLHQLRPDYGIGQQLTLITVGTWPSGATGPTRADGVWRTAVRHTPNSVGMSSRWNQRSQSTPNRRGQSGVHFTAGQPGRSRPRGDRQARVRHHNHLEVGGVSRRGRPRSGPGWSESTPNCAARFGVHFRNCPKRRHYPGCDRRPHPGDGVGADAAPLAQPAVNGAGHSRSATATPARSNFIGPK